MDNTRWYTTFLRVTYTYNNESDAYKARGLIGMTWGTTIGGLLGAMLQLAGTTKDSWFEILGYAIGKNQVAYALIVLATLWGLFIIPALVNRGQLENASRFMVANLVHIALFAYVPNQLTSFLMMAYSLPLIAAGVLLNRRDLFITFIGIVIHLVSLVALWEGGYLDDIATGVPSSEEIVIYGTILFGLSAVIIDVFAGRQQTIFQQNLSLAADLQQSLAVMQEAEAERIKAEAERRQLLEEQTRLQELVIAAQREALKDLSTPIIPLLEGIIVMPLVGNIDSMRAQDIMRSLLAGIGEFDARVIILDITGVPIVDTGVANHLSKSMQAAQLKGAHTIITGVSNAVAETIVELGISWSSIQVNRDLQSGLMTALKLQGRHII